MQKNKFNIGDMVCFVDPVLHQAPAKVESVLEKADGFYYAFSNLVYVSTYIQESMLKLAPVKKKFTAKAGYMIDFAERPGQTGKLYLVQTSPTVLKVFGDSPRPTNRWFDVKIKAGQNIEEGQKFKLHPDCDYDNEFVTVTNIYPPKNKE